MPRIGLSARCGYPDLALLAMQHDPAGQRSSATDLDHVRQRRRIGRLAENAMIEALAAFHAPISTAYPAVHRGPSSSPVTRKARIGAARTGLLPHIRRSQRQRTPRPALHVDRAPAVEHLRPSTCAANGGRRPTLPHRPAARRRYGPRKGRRGTAFADSRIEIVDVGSSGSVKLRARRRSPLAKAATPRKIERERRLMRRNRLDSGSDPARSATHCSSGVGSIPVSRRRARHQSRSNSLMPVLARVWASTVLTMTAQ